MNVRAKEDGLTTAWLIERIDAHLCYARDGVGWGCEWVTFTDPVAWWFDTKAEAEAIINERCLFGVLPVEHGWVA
jgi:hypothetical protein